MKTLLKYHPSELKMWLRKWLLSYRFADFTHQEHLAIIERVEARMRAYVDWPDEQVRLPMRSLAQYMCQSGLRPRGSLIVTELMAYGLLPLGLLWWLVRGLFAPPAGTIRARGVRWNQNKFRYRHNPDVYHTPGELKPDAPPTVFAGAYLRWDDVAFLRQVIAAAAPALPLRCLQWLFKLLKEIAWARPLVERYPSDYILLDAEYDCAIAVLTLYAHRHGRKLYNVQHGDIFISATNGFFETDRFYCWGEFYIDMLKQVRGRSDFRVYTNPSFLLSQAEKTVPREGIGVFMPILETMPTEENQRAFAQALNDLARRYPVRLRPHPAQRNQCDRLLPYLSPKVEITDSLAETSKAFSLRHRVIVGSVSAALLEAIMIGREVVCFRGKYVDDVAGYHFSYHRPNCHLCDLGQLAETVLAQMEKTFLSYAGADA